MLDQLQHNPFQSCDSLKSVGDAMAGYSDELGLPFFSYLLLKGPDSANDVLLTNYDEAWRERYVARSYKHTDPAAVVSRSSRLPFWWDQSTFLRPFKKSQKQVFYEAREFHINAGYSVPVAGPHGDQAVFTLAASAKNDMLEALRASGPELLVTALQAHDRVMDILRTSGGRDAASSLTRREIECLKWTAEGKTSAGIGDVLCISSATINYHLNKAIKKLGAANRHHAAIIALKSNVIS
jgi:DNA-binding CsgD family transcriptional regulator